jgi:hypothetical protein
MALTTRRQFVAAALYGHPIREPAATRRILEARQQIPNARTLLNLTCRLKRLAYCRSEVIDSLDSISHGSRAMAEFLRTQRPKIG